MYSVTYTNKFQKDYHLATKRGYKISLIQNIISLIANKKSLPAKCNAHKLSGNYNDCWECHIQLDWLLIWQINEETNTLTFTRTGTHSDLF
jgi:mRNA interferase YafQ